MKQDYLNEIYSFLESKLDCLSYLQTEALGWRYEYDNYGDEVENYYDEIIHDLGCERYGLGCSKIVLFFDEYPDVVIKIPFQGVRDLDEDTFEVTDERCYREDYCNLEYKIYQHAVQEKLDKIFAKEEFLGFYLDLPLYVAERCPDDYLRIDNASEDSKQKASKLASEKLDEYSDLTEYLPIIIEQYGEDFAERLVDFFNVNDIDDLHYDNVALKDGWFKFIDYSSFNY